MQGKAETSLMLVQSYPKFTKTGGQVEVTEQIVPDAPAGNILYRIVTHSKYSIAQTPKIPINPTHNYKFEVYLRSQSSDVEPRGQFYLGATVFDWQQKRIKGGAKQNYWAWYYFVWHRQGSSLKEGWNYFEGRIGRHQADKFPEEGRFMSLAFVVRQDDPAVHSKYEISSCSVMRTLE